MPSIHRIAALRAAVHRDGQLMVYRRSLLGLGAVIISASVLLIAPAYGSDGTFDRAWGKDVGGPGASLCTVAVNCAAGTAGSLGGEFNRPGFVAADGSGNVYVVDGGSQGNGRIQKFDSSGNFLLAWGKDVGGGGIDICTQAAHCQAGNTGAQGGEFGTNGPAGVATDPSGNVYVSEFYANRIQKFDSSGHFLEAFGKNVGGAGVGTCTVAANCQAAASGGLGGEFWGPQGIASDASGNIYVVDVGNERIQEFDSSFKFLRAYGENVGGVGQEICTDATRCSAGTIGGQGGQFDGPVDIAADTSGSVYVTDSRRVQKFDSSGNFLSAWGKDVGGTGVEACTVAADCQPGNQGVQGGQFSGPAGLTTDAANEVYVADESAGGRIQKFDSSGNFLSAWGKDVGGTGVEVCTVAANCDQGTPGGKGGEFASVSGVAVDTAGDVYAGDTSNQRIQKFAPASPPASRTLTVSTSGAGAVSASGARAVVTGPGIDCSTGDQTQHNHCSTTVADGTQITLTAAPASDGGPFTAFTGGGCGATNPCTVTMNADQSVDASFAAAPPAGRDAGVNISPVEGQSFSGRVLTTACGVSPDSSSIDWGDGTPASAGRDAGDPSGAAGDHTYAEEGVFTGTITYHTTDCEPHDATQHFQATVTDAPLSAAGRDVSGPQGQALVGTVAHFADADPRGAAGDYSAQIQWGDGSTTAGTVTASPAAGFDVTGTHSYASAGSFTTTVRISDSGGSTATATATATAITTTSTPITTTTTAIAPLSPPRVVRIDAIAPPTAGGPVVLKAVTDGQTDSIAWNLAGDGHPEISCPAGQSAVSFRAPAGTTSVTATAIGPGGTGLPLTTSVTVAPGTPLSATQRPLAARVRGALAKAPPVYTCSAPTDFTIKRVGGNTSLVDNIVLRACTTPKTQVIGGLQFIGCLRRLTGENQIPQAMRGMLPSFEQYLHLGGAFANNSNLANIDLVLGLTDAYITYGDVKVNGLTLKPQSDSAIVVAPQLDKIVSSDAQMAVGDVVLQNTPSFIMNLKASGGSIPLGSFARAAGGLADIAGFALGGDISVALDDSGGTFGLTIHVHLSLPSFLKVGDVSAEGDVTLKATNDNGLVIDNLQIGPIDADLGALSVQAVQLNYTRATDEWDGQGKACVIGDVCLDMIPPHGGVKIRRGSLVSLGASYTPPPPGIELFAGVSLTRIGFGFGLDPTRLLANAQITAETILQINGTVVLAFPSAATPFVLDRSEVPDFPDDFYGRQFQRVTLGVGADASIVLPVLGATPLAKAYLLYEYPSYFALGGGVTANLFDVIDIHGQIDGEFNGDNGRFNLKGDIHGCVVDVVCAGVVAVISSRGLGGCLTIPFPTGDLNVGGGVQYSPFHLFLWPFDGCRWSPFVQSNVFSPSDARAASAGVPFSVHIKRAERSRAIRLDGVDGAPSVRVRTPSGDVLESPPQSGLTHDPAIRILRGEKAKITVIGLVNPKPGTYTIELLPGSPAIKAMSQASDQPAAHVSASVIGKGAQRTLVYNVRRRTAQRVTFVEQTKGGARDIGTVIGGGHGRIKFSPAPGLDHRTVVAEFELAGMPAERLTVARFTPVSPILARPARLRLIRRGGTLQINWKPVPGAASYEVVTRLNAAGERLVRTRRASLKLRVAAYDGGRIAVRAIATLRAGNPALATLRPAGHLPTRLGPLPRPRRK